MWTCHLTHQRRKNPLNPFYKWILLVWAFLRNSFDENSESWSQKIDNEKTKRKCNWKSCTFLGMVMIEKCLHWLNLCAETSWINGFTRFIPFFVQIFQCKKFYNAFDKIEMYGVKISKEGNKIERWITSWLWGWGQISEL